jgi:FixJ family two-component response regulator
MAWSEPPGSNQRGAAQAQVFVVDDDALVRTAVTRLLAGAGFVVRGYPSAEAFLAERDPEAHGCIVLDISLPGQDGLALQHTLAQEDDHMPVIFLTGQSDVPITVRAMREGAFDFLTKPVDEKVLFATVSNALRKDEELRHARQRRAQERSCLAALTPRERQVLVQVAAGRLNKQIAYALGTAEKTIKVHRARVMDKMRVRSVAELVRIVDRSRLSDLATAPERGAVAGGVDADT